jgi:hypothetical protein
MSANTLQLLAVLNMVASLLLPLLHSVVTNINASEPVKTVITALLAAVTGFFTPFLAGTQSWATFDWQLALISIGTVFLGTVLSHYGLWKPLQVTGSAGVIQSVVPGGIGGSSNGDHSPAVVNAFPAPVGSTVSPAYADIQAAVDTQDPTVTIPTDTAGAPPAPDTTPPAGGAA